MTQSKCTYSRRHISSTSEAARLGCCTALLHIIKQLQRAFFEAADWCAGLTEQQADAARCQVAHLVQRCAEQLTDAALQNAAQQYCMSAGEQPSTMLSPSGSTTAGSHFISECLGLGIVVESTEGSQSDGQMDCLQLAATATCNVEVNTKTEHEKWQHLFTTVSKLARSDI